MNDKQLPECLARLEPYVRQYCELMAIESQFSSALRVPSTEETATRMAVRLAAEREIQSRKDYLAAFITQAVVREFQNCGHLSS